MSRAFVKESDGEVEELPDRPLSPHPNLVTPEGLALIDGELARLAKEQAEADPDDRVARARIGRDLRYWRSRRASAQLVPPAEGTGRVQFGATVGVRRKGGPVQTFRIVGEDEADPPEGKLSYVSPLARALLGKRDGDVVTVANAEWEIERIA